MCPCCQDPAERARLRLPELPEPREAMTVRAPVPWSATLSAARATIAKHLHITNPVLLALAQVCCLVFLKMNTNVYILCTP